MNTINFHVCIVILALAFEHDFLIACQNFMAYVCPYIVSQLPTMQDIYNAYRQPFAVTYLGASLMVVYLPIAFIKDWFYRKMKNCSSRSGKLAETVRDSADILDSPLKYVEQKISAMELEGNLVKKNSELNLSLEDEKPLLDEGSRKQDRELTKWEIVRYGLYLAPLWFSVEVTEFLLVFLFLFFRLFFLDGLYLSTLCCPI